MLDTTRTLAEIKAATCRLSQAEQGELLCELAGTARARRPEADAVSRLAWTTQLQTLRDSIGAGEPTIGGEQILAELRAERT